MKKWALLILLTVVLATTGGCKRGGWSHAKCDVHVVHSIKTCRNYSTKGHQYVAGYDNGESQKILTKDLLV